MAHEVIMPRVDMDMTTGKITQWFVKEGASVKKGEPLFEIETDKAAMDIEAPADGIARRLSQAFGEPLPVGSVIGWIYGVDEPLAPIVDQARPSPVLSEALAPLDLTPAETATAGPVVPAQSGKTRATPLARRLARERGLALEGLTGSGPLGRLQGRDVERAPGLGTVLHREWLARGAGAPIVFLHGFGGDLNGWRPLNARMKAPHGHLAIDLPGHGLSDLDSEVSLENFVAAIAETLRAEGVQALHLVAHSLGALFAGTLAAAEPARVRSLTLLSPAGLGAEINGDFARGFLAADDEASLARWLAVLAVNVDALGAAIVKSTLRQRAARPLVETQTRIRKVFFPGGKQTISLRDALQSYPGPTRIVFGVEDRIIPAAQASGLPGAVALHFFPGVAHMPHFEARAEVAQIVEDNVAAGERRRA